MKTNWEILNEDAPDFKELRAINKTCGNCRNWENVATPHYMDKNEVCGKCNIFNTIQKKSNPHCDIWKKGE